MGRSPFVKHNFRRGGFVYHLGRLGKCLSGFFFSKPHLPAGKTEKYQWCGTPGFEGFFVPDHCASNVSSCNPAAKFDISSVPTQFVLHTHTYIYIYIL